VKRQATGGLTTLQARFETGPAGFGLVVLAGAIDENSDLVGLFERMTGDTVLNMRAVERVNSMGVHGWIPWVTRFSANHLLMIDEISYALVQSANAVANMFGSAQVRSCMAPYFCATCKDNVTVAVTSYEVASTGWTAPAKQCARCGSAMEFDELDGYFDFFKMRAGK